MLLYWLIATIWAILGAVIFWIVLSVKWSRIDRFQLMVLETSRILLPIPGHPGYLDLKFSILRHAIVFLLSAAIIYFLHNVPLLLYPLLFANTLYAMMTTQRYNARKQFIKDARNRPNGSAHADIISIPIKASFLVVIFSFACLALLFILFAIRP